MWSHMDSDIKEASVSLSTVSAALQPAQSEQPIDVFFTVDYIIEVGEITPLFMSHK